MTTGIGPLATRLAWGTPTSFGGCLEPTGFTEVIDHEDKWADLLPAEGVW